MEKKSNKLVIILMIIFMVLSLGLGGFILYDKVIKKDETENVDKSKDKDNDNTNNEENDAGNDTIKGYEKSITLVGKGNTKDGKPIPNPDYTLYKTYTKVIQLNGKNHTVTRYYYINEELHMIPNYWVMEEGLVLREETYLDDHIIENIKIVDTTGWNTSDDMYNKEKLVPTEKDAFENLKIINDTENGNQYLTLNYYEKVTFLVSKNDPTTISKENGDEYYTGPEKCFEDVWNDKYLRIVDDNGKVILESLKITDTMRGVAIRYKNDQSRKAYTNMISEADEEIETLYGSSFIEIHDDYFYYIEDLICEKENIVKEYKYTISNGKVKKDLVHEYQESDVFGFGATC